MNGYLPDNYKSVYNDSEIMRCHRRVRPVVIERLFVQTLDEEGAYERWKN